MNNFKIPINFFFGASISSHQVEGGNNNNWTEWEKKNAIRLANTAESRKGWVPIWDEVKDYAKNPNNYISGKAADHLTRFNQDFDIARQLNLNSIRFSIEWSRIEPEEGKFNSEAILHYHNYIDALIGNKLEPFMTIWHWTTPIWFEQKQGFEKEENTIFFERFVELLLKEYGSKIKYWITLNEPRIYSSESFLNGRWPPQRKGFIKYISVMMNLRNAHKKAFKLIKSYDKNLNVGIAENIASYTSGYGIINRITRKLFSYYEIRLAKSFSDHSDFIGLNYYFHRHIHDFKADKIAENKDRISDLGWDLYPSGIHAPLTRLSKLNKPIIITENGLADMNDSHREWFIRETFKSIEKSLKEGVDIRGYLHWSLLDNFEWDSGFWPRFGLIEVDYKNNFKRTIRKSALEYSKLIKSHSENG